jgi:hypothetical protein
MKTKLTTAAAGALLGAALWMPGTALAGMTTHDMTTGVTPQDLAAELAGPGVQVSNVTYTGAQDAAGSADGADPVVGFAGGVTLSTGNITTFQGPNTIPDAGTTNETVGDPQLDTLAGDTTYDAAVLDFDFTPDRDHVALDYVFGSEEYNEYVGQFNDVFGFFVNGQNCALTPDNQPVSVNTINKNVNPFVFRNNDLSDGPAQIDTEFDGLTTTLHCSAPVNPGVPNHMRLAIADTGDTSVDSGVLVRAASLVSTACSDGIDNDGDGKVDLADPGCSGSGDNDEFDAPPQGATPTPTPTPSPTPTPVPPPVTGQRLNVETLSGKVTVRVPGRGLVNLSDLTAIPTGSTVDTRHGVVELTSTGAGGTTQSAKFFDGLFKVTQTKGAKPVTDLKLTEALAPCPKKGAKKSGALAARKRAKKRSLWGDGHGVFRTRGRRSAATVSGTKWFVQDSCAGTLTRVARGVVAVRDFGKSKTVKVRAGHRYLAR